MDKLTNIDYICAMVDWAFSLTNMTIGAILAFWIIFRTYYVIEKSKTFLILHEFNQNYYVKHQEKIYLLVEINPDIFE